MRVLYTKDRCIEEQIGAIDFVPQIGATILMWLRGHKCPLRVIGLVYDDEPTPTVLVEMATLTSVEMNFQHGEWRMDPSMRFALRG
jgi:hypothetical protein